LKNYGQQIRQFADRCTVSFDSFPEVVYAGEFVCGGIYGEFSVVYAPFQRPYGGSFKENDSLWTCILIHSANNFAMFALGE